MILYHTHAVALLTREEFKDEEMPDVKKLDIRNFL
jgi:hypothetical protein